MSLYGYGRLSVDILVHKMSAPQISHTSLLGLHVFSYADTTNMDNLTKPLATAFFFYVKSTGRQAIRMHHVRIRCQREH